jgi:hypothetical protein
MKHILNNLSEEEKNSIRAKHTGSLEVNTSKFSKLVESTLGDAKPMINEDETDMKEKTMTVQDMYNTLTKYGKVGQKITLVWDGKYINVQDLGPVPAKLVGGSIPTDNRNTLQKTMDALN